MIQESDFPLKADSVEEAWEIFEKNKDTVFKDTQTRLKADVAAGNKIVLVYQMGKVGSTTYVQSLEDVDHLDVIQIHRLNNRNNQKMISHFLARGMVQVAIKERRWQAIFEFIRNHPHQIHILSAMRNPIDRNISAFFQNTELQGDEDTGGLINQFLNSYPHQLPQTWFDEQFRDALGIDIYDYPFDKQRGWDSFNHNNYNCLLMTAELDDVRKTEAINSFLGTRLKNITRQNIGASKEYSDLYGKFKGAIELPESYIDSQLNSQVVSHFYTPEQIAAFKLKWGQTSPAENVDA